MRRALGIGIGLLLVAAIAWAMWPAGAGPAVAVRTADGSGASGSAIATANEVEAKATAQRVEAMKKSRARPSERPLVSNGKPDDPSLSHLRGRCVAEEDGRPLAGCSVKLEATARIEVTTGADGVFDLHFATTGDLTLAITAPDRVHRNGGIDGHTAGQHEDLGDIKLTRGFPLRGVVVRSDGRPAANQELCVIPVNRSLPWQRGRRWIDAKSDADGAFVFESPVPAGDLLIQLFSPATPERLHVDPIAGIEPQRIVLKSIEEIAGIVVDDQDKPVEDVVIATDGGNQDKSDSAGEFRLRALKPESGPTRLVVRDPARCEPGFTPLVVPWGSKDVRIVLKSGVSVTIDVVDDAGAPVNTFDLVITRVGSPRNETWEPRQCKPERGRIVVDDVCRGRNVVWVFTDLESLSATEPEIVEITESMPPIRVVLARLFDCDVRVTDAAGTAIAGADVELARVGAAPEIAMQGEHWPMARPTLFTPWYRGTELISSDHCNDKGAATVHAPADLRGFLLRIRKGESAPLFVSDPALSPSVPLQLVLPAECTVTGSVDLHGQARQQFGIVLLRSDGTQRQSAWDRPIEPKPDGSFRIDHVAAGDYRVELCRHSENDDHSPFEPGPVPVATRDVHLVAGDAARVTLEAPVPEFGSVHGRLVVVGGSESRWEVDLIHAANWSRRGTFHTEGDGSFVADRVLPGRYHLAVRRAPMNDLVPPAILAEEFEVLPGAALQRDFTLVPRRLVLHLRSGDDWPLHFVRFYCIGGWTNFLQPEELAWSEAADVVFDPAPELPVRICRVLDQSVWSEPVTMPQDKTEFSADVIVPGLKWH